MQNQIIVSNVNLDQWIASVDSSHSVFFAILVIGCLVWLTAITVMCVKSLPKLWNFKKQTLSQSTIDKNRN